MHSCFEDTDKNESSWSIENEKTKDSEEKKIIPSFKEKQSTLEAISFIFIRL
jgi:hypothetical protein